MALSPSALIERARTPGGKKAIKYTAVSAISVVVYQVALAFLYGVLRWKAARANISANVVGGVPSYYLNRRWAWGKSGRSHLMKEIVPFWVIAFVGIGFSTWAASVADHFGEHAVDTHLMRTLIVLSAAFGSFALLWVGKFILFNKFIFVTRDPDVQAALADEIVA